MRAERYAHTARQESGRAERPSNGMNRPRVSILTFGCRANQYESDAIRAALSSAVRTGDRSADLVLLNGCTVTHLAERKARQAARRIRRDRPDAIVVLVGCIAEAVREGLTHFDEADLIAGNRWKGRITEVVVHALAGRRGILPQIEPMSLDSERSDGPVGRVRAFLRVQDGCSLACSYCRPTQVRGPSRSKSIEAAADEAAHLVRLGYPEIVLTGINLAQYASPRGGLPELVRAILGSADMTRLRLASMNPIGLTDALLDVFREDERLCRHFHVPLQSGDDRILRAMRRGTSISAIEARIAAVRDTLPDATFGTDLIVGFPGEDDAAFAATCDAVARLDFVNLHVFRFSPRSGTDAALLPNRVPDRVKRDRANRLTGAWHPIRRRILDSRIGTIQDVLVESRQDGRWQGYTADYIYVRFESAAAIRAGERRAVRILHAGVDGLEGVDDDRDRAS